MEKWQKEHIVRNLPQLQAMTDCNVKLLAILKSKRVLAAVDIQKLDSRRFAEGNSAQSAMLYDIIPKRRGGYEVMSQALFECYQTGALQIMLEGFRENKIGNPLSKCNIPIIYEGILSAEVSFQGEPRRLREICKDISQEDLAEIFNNSDDSEYEYVDVFVTKVKKLTLVEDTIPKSPPLYISRLISNRLKIIPKLFSEECEDVFVFKGIGRRELSNLANPHSTSTSLKQMQKITSRFILLENDVDWEEICAITTKPTHLIRVEARMTSGEPANPNDNKQHMVQQNEQDRFSVYSKMTDFQRRNSKDAHLNNDYILEETVGNSSVLWKWIESASKDMKSYITEQELVNGLNEQEHSRGICISDTPGMGKTCLLSSLARQTCNLYPDRLVAYIPLGQLVQNMGDRISDQITDHRIALEHILDMICPSPLSKSIMLTATMKKTLQWELFFDALDEVPNKYINAIKELLKALSNERDYTRVYVTSRPHLRRELETTLGVVSYDIRPFTEGNQLEHLVHYWKQEIPKADEQKLNELAGACLKTLKASLKNQDKDVMGIPLLCFIMSQSYKKDAELYSHPSRRSSKPLLEVTSVNNLYDKFISQRLEPSKIPVHIQEEMQEQNWDLESIKSYHTWMALKLLYPDLAQDYAEQYRVKTVKATSFHFQFGILDCNCNGGRNVVEFVHLTVAEFLVSEYFAQVLICQSTGDVAESERIERALRIIDAQVFCGEKRQLMARSNIVVPADLAIVGFSNPVMARFIDQQLGANSKPRQMETSIQSKVFESMRPERLLELLQCAILDQLGCLFEYLVNCIKTGSNSRRHRLEEFLLKGNTEIVLYGKTLESAWFLLCLATTFLGANQIDTLVQLVPDVFQVESRNICPYHCSIFACPLHQAFCRANYELVEYLAGKMEINTRSLFSKCVDFSDQLDAETAKDKVDITELLLSKYADTGSETKNRSKCSYPLIAVNVHMDIVKLYIEQCIGMHAETDGADNNDGLIDCAAKAVPIDQFYKLCKMLYFPHHLQVTIVYFEVTESKIVPFSPMGWDFPMIFGPSGKNRYTNIVASVQLVSRNGAVILNLIAAANGRNGATVEYYLSLDTPANSEGNDKEGNSILHRCAIAGVCLNILKYFLNMHTKNFSESGLQATKQNSDGHTFLHIVPSNYTAKEYHAIVKVIIAKQLSHVFRISGSDGVTPLHTAVYSLEILPDTLKLLTSSHTGFVDLNAADKDGNTVLHCAVMGKRSPELIQIMIRLEMDHPNGDDDVKQSQMADVSKRNKLGQTAVHLFPIYYSAQQYHQLVKYLIGAGLENVFAIPENYGLTPLQVAVCALDLLPDTLELLGGGRHTTSGQFVGRRAENHLDFGAVTVSGRTFLHLAVNAKRSIDVILCLLKLGSTQKALDIMKQDNEGRTFLHLFEDNYSSDDYHQVVEFLLQEGYAAIFNIKSYDGLTPLQWIKFYRELQPKTLDQFRKHNLMMQSDVDFKGEDDVQGHLLIFSALQQKKSLEEVEFLVQIGVDWRRCNRHNSSVVNECASHGLIEHLKYFVSLGADVNARDNDGDNALQCVVTDASENVLQIVEYLISKGVDTTNVNKSGKTALVVAIEMGRDKDVINALDFQH